MDTIGGLFKDMQTPSSRKADGVILLIVVSLCVFGIVMIWSASMYNAKLNDELNYDEFYYAKRQTAFFLAGFAGMWFISLLDADKLKAYSFYFMLAILFMLLITAWGVGMEDVNGAIRSIRIGPIEIMPAEFAKIAVLFFMSYFMELVYRDRRSLRVFIIVMILCAVTFAVIYRQPALTTAAIITALMISIYFLGGGNVVLMVTAIVLAAPVAYFRLLKGSWRLERLDALADPFSDVLDSGWQPANSIMALGSGGLMGRGPGNSIAKLSFLPEPQNDYIFSIIGEELGFVGCIILTVVYLLLIIRLLQLSIRASSRFGALFTAGTAVLFSMQVALNIAVCTNLIPSTGVSLPFVSYGGSSLLSNMAIVGVVLNISRRQASVPSAAVTRKA